jgi:hypothetical protein
MYQSERSFILLELDFSPLHVLQLTKPRINVGQEVHYRCTQLLAPFNSAHNLHFDGLSPDLFDGTVDRFIRGNPPYDGNDGGTTIKDLLNSSETASKLEARAFKDLRAFRAVYFLPLNPNELRLRTSTGKATALMILPANTVSFIPNDYWYGRAKISIGNYDQIDTRMIILAALTKTSEPKSIAQSTTPS